MFDHPYYVLTNKDGEFTIPHIPAGAKVQIMAWHEGVGYVLGREGTPIVIGKDKKHTMDDIKVKAPADGK